MNQLSIYHKNVIEFSPNSCWEAATSKTKSIAINIQKIIKDTMKPYFCFNVLRCSRLRFE